MEQNRHGSFIEQAKAIHWLVVGFVSPRAKEWIEQVGGQVKEVSSDPHLIAVGLAYDPNGAWVWSHGRREHREGIEFWSHGEIQEASTGLNLLYPRNAECCSVETNFLIMPDEEFDSETKQLKEPEPIPLSMVTDTTAEDDGGLGEIEDHPF